MEPSEYTGIGLILAGFGLIGGVSLRYARGKLAVAATILLGTLGVCGVIAGAYAMASPSRSQEDPIKRTSSAPSTATQTVDPLKTQSLAAQKLDPPPKLDQDVVIKGRPEHGHTYLLFPNQCSENSVVAAISPQPSSRSVDFNVSLDDDAPEDLNVEVSLSREDTTTIRKIVSAGQSVHVQGAVEGETSLSLKSLSSSTEKCSAAGFLVLLKDFTLTKGP